MPSIGGDEVPQRLSWQKFASYRVLYAFPLEVYFLIEICAFTIVLVELKENEVYI